MGLGVSHEGGSRIASISGQRNNVIRIIIIIPQNAKLEDEQTTLSSANNSLAEGKPFVVDF